MKFLKYFLLVILGLVAIFFLMGLLKSSVEYGHKITVNKSAETAWLVTQDQSKLHLWLDGFKSMEHLSGEKGQVGSTYKVTVNPGEGQSDFEMIETIVSFKENDHIELHFDSEMMNFEQLMSFKESGGNTTIETKSVVKGKGIFMRSMFVCMELLGGSFTTQEVKNIEALKKVIEES